MPSSLRWSKWANKERRGFFVYRIWLDGVENFFIITERRIIMNTLVIVLIAAVVLVCAYAFYGRWVAKILGH